MNKICLIEDDLKMSNLLIEEFEDEGLEVLHSLDGKIILNEDKPTLDVQVFIVDWNLPDLTSGIQVVKKIKENYPGSTIIMISGYSSTEEICCGLAAGANHFLTKPFDLSILVLKVKNSLEQITHLQQIQNKLNKNIEQSKPANFFLVSDHPIRIFPNELVIMINQTPIHLTQTEYIILSKLLENYPSLASKEVIVSELKNQSKKDFTTRGLDVHITNLRKKLKDHGLYVINFKNQGLQLK